MPSPEARDAPSVDDGRGGAAEVEALLKQLPVVELLALIVIALGCLGFHLWEPTTFASDDDYQAVARTLAAEGKPGDAVLLFPWWAERARLFVPDGIPVTGYLGSDKDDLEHAPRIWVLAEPRLPKADAKAFEAAFLPGRTKVGDSRRFGALELSLYANGRYRAPIFSGADALAQARVYFETPDGQRADCRSNGAGFACPADEDGNPVHVATEWHELHYVPRRCVYLRPPGRGIKLVVEFASVPPGQLTLEAGLIWEHAPLTGPQYSTVDFAAEDSNRQALATIALPPGLDAEQKADGTLSAPGPVRVTAVAEHARNREVCVELFIHGAAGAM